MRDEAEKSEYMLKSHRWRLLYDDRINKSDKILINIDDVQPEI